MEPRLKVTTLFTIFFLTACNSATPPPNALDTNNTQDENNLLEGNTDKNSEADLNSSSPLPTTIEDVSGFWNSTAKHAIYMQDVSYTHITEDGNFTIYNYLNDSFDNGEDCYQVSTFLLTKNEGRSFYLENDSTYGQFKINYWTETGANISLPMGSSFYERISDVITDTLEPLCERTDPVSYNFSPSIKDLVGLWDETKTRPEKHRKAIGHYSYIDELGVSTTYFFNNDEQCFYSSSSKGLLIDIGNGYFETYTPQGYLYKNIKGSIVDDILYFSEINGINKPSISKRVLQNKDEFLSPMCES